MFLDHSRIGNFITSKSKEEIRCNCVYCNDEKFHMYINIKKQVFNCFRCGAKGKTNVTKTLLGNVITSSLTKESSAANKQALKLPESLPEVLSVTGRNYLFKRGILESDVLYHKIYCASSSSIYIGRLIIPSQPFYGFCEYFTARSYVKHIFPKYLNPSGNRDKAYLSPLIADEKHLQYWSNKTVCIVEGPFDMLKASRHGPTLALLGKSLSEYGRRSIISRFKNVYILLDKGVKESIAAIRVKDSLTPYMDKVIILDCPKKDPGEMNPDDFDLLFSTLPIL